MPESLFQPDNDIQITGLAIETPQYQPERPFRLEELITASDWVRIKEYLDVWRQKTDVRQFCRQLAHVFHIFPERTTEFAIDPPLTHRMVEAVELAVGAYDGRSISITELLDLAASTRTIAPRILNYSGLYERIKERFEQGLESPNVYIDYLIQASAAAVAFPEQRDRFIKENEWRRTLDYLRQSWERVASYDDDSAYLDHLDAISYARLIFPDRLNALQPENSLWSKVEPTLLKCKSNFASNYFLSWTAAAKMVYAEKIILDENGLQLILPISANRQTADVTLPEQRRY